MLGFQSDPTKINGVWGRLNNLYRIIWSKSFASKNVGYLRVKRITAINLEQQPRVTSKVELRDSAPLPHPQELQNPSQGFCACSCNGKVNNDEQIETGIMVDSTFTRRKFTALIWSIPLSHLVCLIEKMFYLSVIEKITLKEIHSAIQ